MLQRLLGGIRWILIVLHNREQRLRGAVLDQFKVYFVSNLGNYIPGSVWSIASRIQMNRTRGIRPLRTSIGIAYEMGLLVWSGCVVGSYVAVTWFSLGGWSSAGLVIILAVLSLLIVHPTTVNLFLRYLLQMLKRPAGLVEVTFGWGIVLWLVSLAAWVSEGLSFFYLLKAFLPAVTISQLATLTSVYALAWTMGFLAVWAPSGLGVREGLMVWLLKTYVEAPLLVVVTVAHRMVNMVVDVVWAFLAFFLNRQGMMTNLPGEPK